MRPDPYDSSNDFNKFFTYPFIAMLLLIMICWLYWDLTKTP